MMSRRGLLLGAVGAAGCVAAAGAGAYGLVEAGALPGRLVLDRALGGCDVPAAAPESAAGPLVAGRFASAACARDVPFTLAYPPGAQDGAALPVCLVLHGFTATERSPFTGLELQRHLADAVRGTGTAATRIPPFVLAAAYGGPRYWHPRAAGDDSRAMLVDEFLPLLARRGLRTDKVLLLGHSMGGYGVLLFAETWPERVAAVAATSPAVWRSWDQTNKAAFDSEADWRRHDVITGGAALRGLPVRIDCGRDDPFATALPALRAALPGADVHLADGCHDNTFWRAVAPAQLAFLGTALG